MARQSTESSLFSSCGVLTETQSSLPASSLPLRPRSCDCMLTPLLQNKSPGLPGSGFSQFSSLFQFPSRPLRWRSGSVTRRRLFEVPSAKAFSL